LETIDWLKDFAAREWVPEVVDLGGGLGIRYVEGERPPEIREFVTTLLARLADGWPGEPPQVILEPGRSLVGQAGLTLYRVGVVKRASDEVTYVAVDGGMSDNPRPQLYGARYSALLANRADEEAVQAYDICGKHCESGDVLIEGVRLPEPRRGDLGPRRPDSQAARRLDFRLHERLRGARGTRAGDAAAARAGDGGALARRPRLRRSRGRGRRRRFGDRHDPVHEGDLPRGLHH